MAIRLNHEAAAAFVPPSASNRKYGQQLVLQQQKFANDQRQGMQDRMYDQQREYRRTAYQLQKDQTDRFVDNQRMQEQQKFAERMQKNSLDAQQQRDLQEAQRRSEMMAKQQEEQRVAQLKAQERADVEDAIKSGAIDQITASEIKKSWALDTRIDLNPEYDEAQRAEAHRENQWNRSKLQENRSQVPSLADMGNKNLQYYVPSMRGYVNREEAAKLGPDVEVQVYQDGKLMPGPSARGPMSAQDYYRADGAMFKKDLASKMSELQGKVDAGEMTLEKGQDLRSLAWQQMQDDYNFAQQALGGSQPVQGGQAAQPPMQGGQPAMPPAPAAQPPAMGMQDLEPAYSEFDGTSYDPRADFTDQQGNKFKSTLDGAWVAENANLPIGYQVTNPNGLVSRKTGDGQWVTTTPDQAVKPTLDVRFPKKSPFADPAAAEAGPHGDWAKKIHADLLKEEDGQSVMHAQVGQPAASPMRAFHQDGRIFEQSPDGNWREVQPVASQPIQQADGSMWQQSPTDGAWRQVPAAVPEQPAREPFAMPPARPLQPGEEDGAATFGPKAPGVQRQPVDTLPMDQTGMQPSQQNVWAEFAAPEQELPQQKKEDATTLAKQPPAVQEDIDFDKLAESADESDRALYGELQSIYNKLVESPQSPMIQNAISVVVNQQSNPKLAAQAYLYLQSQGIDLSKLSRPKKRQRAGMSGIR